MERDLENGDMHHEKATLKVTDGEQPLFVLVVAFEHIID